MYSEDQSEARTFTAVSGAPVDSEITYDASSSASTEENFYIPDPKTSNTLVCAESTGIDTYNITLTANVGATDNYNAATLTDTCTWTVKADYKAIQKTFTVGTTSYTVNFLPAVADADWASEGLKFYKKDGDSYTELGGISSMSTLKTAIANIDTEKTPTENAGNVYTDATATGVTFYGTISRIWNDTFYQTTKQAGYPERLESDFATAIHNENIKTLYGDYKDDDGNWQWDYNKAVGNWNAANTSSGTAGEPQLGVVGYNSFYSAYTTSLLSSNAAVPFSSRAFSNDYVYAWDATSSQWWSGGYRALYSAVVLSQVF